MNTCLDWILAVGSIVASITAIVAIFLSIFSFRKNSKITLQPQRSRLWLAHSRLNGLMKHAFDDIEYEKTGDIKIAADKFLEFFIEKVPTDSLVAYQTRENILSNFHNDLSKEYNNSLGIFEQHILEHIDKNLGFANTVLGVCIGAVEDKSLENELIDMFSYYTDISEQKRVLQRVNKYLQVHNLCKLKPKK